MRTSFIAESLAHKGFFRKVLHMLIMFLASAILNARSMVELLFGTLLIYKTMYMFNRKIKNVQPYKNQAVSLNDSG